MLNVLLVNTEQDAMDQLEAYLLSDQNAPYSVTKTAHSIEVETFLGVEDYDVIIWDPLLQLPNHDSVEDLIKSHDKLSNTVLLYTASEEALVKNPSLSQDKHKVILFPCIKEDFLFRIKKAVALCTPLIGVESETKITLDDLQKEKETLISQLKMTLNHEIRNPLTSVLIGAQALGRRFEEGTTEKSIIKEVEQCARRIKHTLDSFGDNVVHDTPIKTSSPFPTKESVVSSSSSIMNEISDDAPSVSLMEKSTATV